VRPDLGDADAQQAEVVPMLCGSTVLLVGRLEQATCRRQQLVHHARHVLKVGRPPRTRIVVKGKDRHESDRVSKPCQMTRKL
jgi:hypothetical protein